MGMFDNIDDFSFDCPNCDARVDCVQTYDGLKQCETIDFRYVEHFHGVCMTCNASFEFDLMDREIHRSLRQLGDYKCTMQCNEQIKYFNLQMPSSMWRRVRNTTVLLV